MRGTRSLRIVLPATWIACVAGALLPVAVLAGAPSNDDFANARPIGVGQLPYSQRIEVTSATREPNEPRSAPCTLYNAAGTIWYKLRLPATRTLLANANAQNFHTTIRVYRGTSLNDLAMVGCNAVVNNTEPNHSRVAFIARANRWYYIQAAFNYGFTDPNATHLLKFSLRTTSAPTNDAFLAAQRVTSLPFSQTVDTSSATIQNSEPSAFGICFVSGATIWYRIKPSFTGTVRADTILSSNFNTVLGIYRRSSTGSLVPVGCGDYYNDGQVDSHARAAFHVASGSTYYIQAGGDQGESGPLTLRLKRVISPPNDNIRKATFVTASSFDLTSSTANATVEAGEPLRVCDRNVLVGGTVWYKWVAPSSGVSVVFSTAGSSFNTVIAVYTGQPGSLAPFLCNDDNGGTHQSRVAFQYDFGTTYWVQVGGNWFDNGKLHFTISN